jgi:hypothetical protein
LADVDTVGAELLEAFGFRLDVIDTQVEIDPRFRRLRFGHALQDDRRVLARWCERRGFCQLGFA